MSTISLEVTCSSQIGLENKIPRNHICAYKIEDNIGPCLFIYFSILKTVRNTSSSGFISEVITNSRFFVWILSVKFKILNNHLDSVQLSIWRNTIHLLLTSRLTSKGDSQDPNSSMVFFGQLLKWTLEKWNHLWKFNICIGFWTILSRRVFLPSFELSYS